MTQNRTENPGGHTTRELSINFDLYTEGDTAFKLELIEQMAKGIAEFRESVISAIGNKNKAVLSAARHRAAFTLAIINDAEFEQAITQLKSEMEQDVACPNGEVLVRLCDEIIASLREEWGVSES